MSMLQLADEPVLVSPNRIESDQYHWTWKAEDVPVRIRLPLDLVSRLRSEIENHENVSTAEIGGVLLGRPGSAPGLIQIHDYAWVDSDKEDGYRPDIAALESLREAHPDLRILGYFRTQLEGALHLRMEETDFITEHFNDPANVVLLIRPCADQYKAGFLFWERDTFIPFSVQDFPFHEESLRRSASSRPVEISPTPQLALTAPAVPKFTIEPPAKPYLRRAFLCFSSVVFAAALAGFLMIDRLFPAPRLQAPVVVAGVPVELRAQADAEGLEVRWNPQSTPVANAREGRVTLVQPNGVNETIDLTFQQLTSGKMYLASWGAAFTGVRFEVVDSRGVATRESFSALPFVPEAEPPAPVVVATKKPAAPRVTEETKYVKAKTVWRPVSVASKPEPRPSLAQANSEVLDTTGFTGKWTYSTAPGRFDGAEPEVVDGVIHQSNGRLMGTMFVHFKRTADGSPDFTHKFQFAGDLHHGRTQIFPLSGDAGTSGTIELVAGNTPNLLEVHFQTRADRGTERSGKMVLIKK